MKTKFGQPKDGPGCLNGRKHCMSAANWVPYQYKSHCSRWSPCTNLDSSPFKGLPNCSEKKQTRTQYFRLPTNLVNPEFDQKVAPPDSWHFGTRHRILTAMAAEMQWRGCGAGKQSPWRVVFHTSCLGCDSGFGMGQFGLQAQETTNEV